jgi:hypothetical protein
VGRKIAQAAGDHATLWFLQYVQAQHPPDKEYRDDGSGDVNYPVANCFRFSKIEHFSDGSRIGSG